MTQAGREYRLPNGDAIEARVQRRRKPTHCDYCTDVIHADELYLWTEAGEHYCLACQIPADEPPGALDP